MNCNRFNRWFRGGFWTNLVEALAMSGMVTKSTSIEHLRGSAPLGLRWERGAKNQAIGLSHGGQTTMLHALTDTLGRPYAFELTRGHI